MFSQKRKEIAGMAKQFKTAYKEECEPDQAKDQVRINPGWLKACGAGMMLLGPCGLFMCPFYATYAIIITIFGAIIYLAACGKPSGSE